MFAEPRTFKAYVRFAGPGPDLPDDIRDVGFGSMSVKLMGVPGPKLMPDERHTQDLITVSTPTFVTPDTRENAKLHRWGFRDLPIFYFLNPLDTHLIDFFMQSLWNETQYNPLATRYWSCVPYLLGEGQAMVYSFRPKSDVITDIPGVPFGKVPPNYLRDNLIATLARQDAEFDLLVQVQTDAHLMPIENAGVRWPERLSPFVPVATVHIPKQNLDTPAHVEFNRTPVDEPVALHPRASTAGQPGSGAAEDVLRAQPTAAGPEPDPAHRADRRRSVRLSGCLAIHLTLCLQPELERFAVGTSGRLPQLVCPGADALQPILLGAGRAANTRDAPMRRRITGIHARSRGGVDLVEPALVGRRRRLI